MTLLSSVSMKDAGVASGAFHMYADAQTLDILQAAPVDRLVVRTFQWDQPTVSYGYLLDTEKVKAWAVDQGLSTLDLVKRPTGGGAVLHTTSDLSFSLAWRRENKFFSDRPRDCYAEIHERLLRALQSFFSMTPLPLTLALSLKGEGNSNPCGQPIAPKDIPLCFNEPVCNDVMLGGAKVIGGALRVTKNAILYQGTIQLPGVPLSELKEAVRRAFA